MPTATAPAKRDAADLRRAPVANAAILFDREAYDAAGLERTMGRNAAGEGLLKGFLRHAEDERSYLWKARSRPLRALEPLQPRLGPPGRPVTCIQSADRHGLAAPGAPSVTTPGTPGRGR